MPRQNMQLISSVLIKAFGGVLLQNMLHTWWVLGSHSEEPEKPFPAYCWLRLPQFRGISNDTGSGGSMPDFQAIDTFAPTVRWDRGSNTWPFRYQMTLGGVARSS